MLPSNARVDWCPVCLNGFAGKSQIRLGELSRGRLLSRLDSSRCGLRHLAFEERIWNRV